MFSAKIDQTATVTIINEHVIICLNQVTNPSFLDGITTACLKCGVCCLLVIRYDGPETTLMMMFQDHNNTNTTISDRP